MNVFPQLALKGLTTAKLVVPGPCVPNVRFPMSKPHFKLSVGKLPRVKKVRIIVLNVIFLDSYVIHVWILLLE